MLLSTTAAALIILGRVKILQDIIILFWQIEDWLFLHKATFNQGN